MNIDSLIARLVRYFNQEMFDVSRGLAPTPLPDAVPGSKHLLYLHIPYCQVLCPFCSFHRVQFKAGAATRYFESLQREIALVAEQGYVFDEVYVGGGTPTVLPDDLIETLSQLRANHPVKAISVETNPDDLKNGGLARLKDAGVSRLSVGVQSFDDALLKEMQRYDKYGSGAEIRDSIERIAGRFETLNVDMIFNFPHQTAESLRRDLDILGLDLGVDQVSFYPLMNIDGKDKTLQNAMGKVSHAREREFYELVVERMSAAGYTRNSAWCFSRKPGMFDEYIVDREEYVGLGSGAFSYLQGALYSSTFAIGEYRRLVASGRTGTVFCRTMSQQDQLRYYLLMQLFGGRLDKKVAQKRFAGRFSSGLWRELAALQVMGAIRDRGSSLELTERGNYLWVVMMREFFSGVNRLRDNMRHSDPRVAVAAQAGE